MSHIIISFSNRHSPFQNMVGVFQISPARKLLGSEEVPLLLMVCQCVVHLLLLPLRLLLLVVVEAEVDAGVVHQEGGLWDHADTLNILLVLLHLDHLVLHLLPVGLHQQLGVLLLKLPVPVDVDAGQGGGVHFLSLPPSVPHHCLGLLHCLFQLYFRGPEVRNLDGKLDMFCLEPQLIVWNVRTHDFAAIPVTSSLCGCQRPTECNNNLTHCSDLCRSGSRWVSLPPPPALRLQGIRGGGSVVPGERGGVAIGLRTFDSLFT